MYDTGEGSVGVGIGECVCSDGGGDIDVCFGCGGGCLVDA